MRSTHNFKNGRAEGLPVEILGAAACIDTIAISTFKPLSADEKALFNPMRCASAWTHFPAKPPNNERVIPRNLIVVEQPDNLALLRLDQICIDKRPEAVVSVLDLALDFLVDSRDDSERLARWIGSHTLWPRQNGYLRRFGVSTRYPTPRRWRAIGGAVYGSLRSKCTGDWCAHVELRVRGASAAKKFGFFDRSGNQRRGIRDALDAGVIDIVAAITGRWPLHSVDTVRLGRAHARSRGERGLSRERAAKRGQALLNRIRDVDDDECAVADLYRHLHDFGISDECLLHLPFSTVLPRAEQ